MNFHDNCVIARRNRNPLEFTKQKFPQTFTYLLIFYVHLYVCVCYWNGSIINRRYTFINDAGWNETRGIFFCRKNIYIYKYTIFVCSPNV